MGYSIAFLGDLAFAGGDGYAAWCASKLDGSKWGDWPERWTPDPEIETTVEDVLAGVRGDIVEFVRDDGRVRLRLLVSKDDAFYLDSRQQVLCAFRQAAEHGGVGSLVIAGWNDGAPKFAVRVAAKAGGASSCEKLEETEIDAVEKGAAYAELEAIVARVVAKAEAANGGFWAKANELAATKEQAADAVAAASTIEESLALVPAALPGTLMFSAQQSLPKSKVVAALAAHADPKSTARMVAKLGMVLGGPPAGEAKWKTERSHADRLLAFALTHALHRRGGADDAVMSVWIDHPDFFLRQHEHVRALGRHALDVRLAAQLGQTKNEIAGSTDSHEWVVAALMASDPKGAPARATKLLEGDVRENDSALQSLDCLVRYFFDHLEDRSPAWEEWLRAVVRYPWSDDPDSDAYDQLRMNAIAMMANWKMRDAIPVIVEHLDAFGIERACRLFEEVGDSAALPALREMLAKAKRKQERACIEHAITQLGGDLEAPKPKKKAAEEKKKPKTKKQK